MMKGWRICAVYATGYLAGRIVGLMADGANEKWIVWTIAALLLATYCTIWKVERWPS